MLYAYGATVIEVVRRKEFGENYPREISDLPFRLMSTLILLAQFFYQRAQSILEVMAKLS